MQDYSPTLRCGASDWQKPKEDNENLSKESTTMHDPYVR